MKKKLTALLCAFFLVGVFGFGQVSDKWLKKPFVEVLELNKQLLFKELAAAPDETVGWGTAYVKSADGLLYFKTSAGVEHNLASATSVGDYLDLPEISEPGTPDATELRLWVQDFHGFSLYSYKDDGGMVRRVGDNVYIGVNNTGSTIPANSAVYSAGNDLDPLPAAVELALAKADDTATMPCIGVAIEAIAAGAYGRYMTVGMIEDVNTSAFSVGDTIYVSKDTAGEFTATKPTAPNIAQEMGTIIVDHASLGAALIVARTATTGNVIGTDVQAWDADLDTYAGITPSADVQSLLACATEAAIRTFLDLESGTDFPVVAHTMASHSDDDTYNISTSGLATVTKGFVHGAVTTATPSEAFTIDWTAKQVHQITITGANLDVTFTNPSAPCRLWLVIIQDDGDDTIDWTNEADLLFPGGVDPVLSTGAGDIDLISFIWDGTRYLGVANYDFD